MNKRYLFVSFLAAFAVFLIDDAKGGTEPKYQIKSRTLAHAPDGSPDSRKDFGIGEWVEFKIVPASTSVVEWFVEGDGALSNRFGNLTILFVGYGENDRPLKVSISVRDKPRLTSPIYRSIAPSGVQREGEGEAEAALPRCRHAPSLRNCQQPSTMIPHLPSAVKAVNPKPKQDPKNKWIGLVSDLETLELLADIPHDFDSECARIRKRLYPFLDHATTRPVDMPLFTRLLGKMDKLSPKVPGSFDWAEIRGAAAEAAGLRLAEYLDDTLDKTNLSADFWKLLHSCADNLASLRKQFQDAGGEHNGELFGNAVDRQSTEGRRKAVANALAPELSSIRFLLYVQIRNALSSVPEDRLKTALQEHGFGDDEIVVLFENLK